MEHWRIGIDLGGTKIEIVALGPDGAERHRHRVPTPAGYPATLEAIAGLVADAEAMLGVRATVGIGIPGVISPATGKVKNANSIALNGHPFDRDISERLGREVRVDNDANCFTLSEATDGAGAGMGMVFGVILGTGSGAGLVFNGRVHRGPHRIAGEWAHNPLPWPSVDELPGPPCWCGKWGCIETYVAGPGLVRDYGGSGGTDASQLPILAAAGDGGARRALRRHADRVARSLATIVNVVDPDAIILGGGVSNMDHLYAELPSLISKHAFGDFVSTPVLKNVHGDSSGVRGAAWLWPAD